LNPENENVPGRSTYLPEPSHYASVSWQNAFVSSKKLFLYNIYYFYTSFLLREDLQTKPVASTPPIFKCETPIPTEHIHHLPSDNC